MNVVHPSSQSNVREPGENPGRLRHCNGYKFPRATAPRQGSGRREGGSRPKSGYRFGCARRVSGVTGTDFSVKEKDEASLSDGFRQDSLDAFILRFAGV